jgi:hypothetical protein
MAPRPPQRRCTDSWLGKLGQVWDFVDARDIDKHVVSLAVFYGTVKITNWAMAYASTYAGSSDVALTIAAVMAPYMALQAAAIHFYFQARKD